MDDTVETIKHRGYTIEIHYDDDPVNPMKEFDAQPLLIMHEGARRKIDFGHNDEYGALLDRALERGRISLDRTLKVFVRWVRTYHDVVAILPFSLLDHSGLTVYLGASAHWADPGGWDSAWVGFILLTKTQAESWFGEQGLRERTQEQLEESLKGSFTEFANYVSGEVYGYVIKDPEGGPVDDDSCWGFYGDDSYEEGGYMREQFISVVDHDADRKHAAKVDLFKRLVER